MNFIKIPLTEEPLKDGSEARMSEIEKTAKKESTSMATTLAQKTTIDVGAVTILEEKQDNSPESREDINKEPTLVQGRSDIPFFEDWEDDKSDCSDQDTDHEKPNYEPKVKHTSGVEEKTLPEGHILPTDILTENLKRVRDAQCRCRTTSALLNFYEKGIIPTDSQMKQVVTAERRHLTVYNSVLYRVTNSSASAKETARLQLVIPISLRNEALLAMYDALVGGGHLGIKKTYNKILEC